MNLVLWYPLLRFQERLVGLSLRSLSVFLFCHVVSHTCSHHGNAICSRALICQADTSTVNLNLQNCELSEFLYKVISLWYFVSVTENRLIQGINLEEGAHTTTTPSMPVEWLYELGCAESMMRFLYSHLPRCHSYPNLLVFLASWNEMPCSQCGKCPSVYFGTTSLHCFLCRPPPPYSPCHRPSLCLSLSFLPEPPAAIPG
jgi:hypothetical protein